MRHDNDNLTAIDTPKKDTPLFDLASCLHTGVGFSGRESHPYRRNTKFQRGPDGKFTLIPVSHKRTEKPSSLVIPKPWFQNKKPVLASREFVSTDAEHRAQARDRFAAANQNELERLGAARPNLKARPKRYRGGPSPVIRNIFKHDEEGAVAILMALTSGRQTYYGEEYAPIFDSAEVMTGERDVEVEIHPERRINIRPNTREMRRQWESHEPIHSGNITEIGSLRFNSDPARGSNASGLLVSYGESKRGLLLRPKDDTSKERGASVLKPEERERERRRERQAIKGYLRLAGEWNETRFMEHGALFPDDRRLARAVDAEQELERAWQTTIDAGKVPSFFHAPYGVALHPGRFGGISAGKQTANRPGNNLAGPEINLTPRSALVLAEIVGGATYQQIGMALGYSKDYADRGAKPAVTALVAELKQAVKVPKYVAGNDNMQVSENVAA